VVKGDHRKVVYRATLQKDALCSPAKIASSPDRTVYVI